jgi:hypothetical protein
MTNNVIKFPNNVIKFPKRKPETIEIPEDLALHKYSLEFAYEVIDNIHDTFHEETGDCIFVDDDYTAMVLFLAETISGMYLMSQGVDHPMQEIATDLFGDVEIDVDIPSEMDYDVSNNDETDEEPTQ